MESTGCRRSSGPIVTGAKHGPGSNRSPVTNSDSDRLPVSTSFEDAFGGDGSGVVVVREDNYRADEDAVLQHDRLVDEGVVLKLSAGPSPRSRSKSSWSPAMARPSGPPELSRPMSKAESAAVPMAERQSATQAALDRHKRIG